MKKYTIKKGQHSTTGLNFGLTFNTQVKFKCKFDKSCLYEFNDIDSYDINKLCGFSTTWFHHKQSGRIGWRCINNEKFELVTYSYSNGFRDLKESNTLAIVYPDQEFTVTVSDHETFYQYVFEMDNQRRIMNNRKKKDWFLFHYLLYPYFGGNKKAPHDMFIYLEKIS